MASQEDNHKILNAPEVAKSQAGIFSGNSGGSPSLRAQYLIMNFKTERFLSLPSGGFEIKLTDEELEQMANTLKQYVKKKKRFLFW